MTTFDIRTRPEQLQKLGEWVSVGKDMVDVELVVDDRMLLAEQGDERMAWDLDGSTATDEYLEVAPLASRDHVHEDPDTDLICEAVAFAAQHPGAKGLERLLDAAISNCCDREVGGDLEAVAQALYEAIRATPEPAP